MARFFVSPGQIGPAKISIFDGDVNHIRRVLRMKEGDELTVCDGEGRDYFCRISSMSDDVVTCDIIDSWTSYVELPVRLHLFQGLPKADKMELIIQKAVELGAAEIIPVAMARSIVKLDEKKAGKKTSRWQGIAESGAKQSGRAIVPEVRQPMSYKQALSYASSLDAVIVPYEKAEGIEQSRALIDELACDDSIRSIGIFIGPEGGFDEKEIELALEAGAKPITLGRRILRTETAGLAILSILMYRLER